MQRIAAEISLKRHHLPYVPKKDLVKTISTDFDCFPYKKWWRGEPLGATPVIIEREAGWRLRDDYCYLKVYPESKGTYPKHKFQGSCNLRIPPMYVEEEKVECNRVMV